jgi:hypothetical protein
MPDEKNEFQHNVFISWSGNRSRHVAQALRDWISMVLQAAKPWTSSTDIDKGSRGLAELAKALENIKVGIICLTPENLSEEWILFEAGALSKTLDPGTRVCTSLLGGLQPQDVPRPLGEFQATKAEKEDTRRLVHTLNKGLGSPVTEPHLNGTFDALWPRLEGALASMPKSETAAPPKRSIQDMVAEILELSRTAAKARSDEEFGASVRRQLAAFRAETVVFQGGLDALSGLSGEGGIRAYLVKEKPKDHESKDAGNGGQEPQK